MDTQSNQYITGDPAFAVDRRGVVVLWNQAAEKSFGVPCHEALGQKCWHLLSGEDVNGNRYCCRHCPIREMGFRHEPVHNFHSVLKTASKPPEQYTISCVAVYDELGREILLHICNPDSRPVATGVFKPGTCEHLDALSQREIEILALLVDKVKTQDIADRLSISIRTVRTHIQHLMYKLQVHKRSEAIKEGKRLKLI